LKRFQEVEAGNIGISSIALSELAFGVQKSQYHKKNIQALEKFTISLEILPYDTKAAYVYGKIRKELESQGTPMGPMDILIVAHALSRNLILVTNNVKEFKRVNKLKVEN